MAHTSQQLREIYLKLPQDLRDALFNVDSSELVRDIGQKHKLTIDKIGELASEIGYVMLGLTHPNKFISNLVERLEVDKQKAKEIAEDINVNVFKKVRESLKKIHGIEDGEKKTESREEILKEIERSEPPVPDILKGSTTPVEENKEEQKYQSGADPYREPIE